MRVLSEEHKRKIGNTWRGKHLPLEHRQKISKALTGKILSLETRKKIGLKSKGRKTFLGCKHTLETRQKIKEARKRQEHPMLGRKHSFETKLKMSETRKGRKQSLETRQKRSKALKGNKNPQWKGGITSQNKKRINTFDWNEIRKEIYKRDNWTCQICGKTCNKWNIQCHHIVPYRISQDDRLENLITLCNVCHGKEEHKYYRSLKNYNQGELF